MLRSCAVGTEDTSSLALRNSEAGRRDKQGNWQVPHSVTVTVMRDLSTERAQWADLGPNNRGLPRRGHTREEGDLLQVKFIDAQKFWRKPKEGL